MTWTITRVEKDETRRVVGCTDDQCEIGVMIDEDRDKYDCEALKYEVEDDKDEGNS